MATIELTADNFEQTISAGGIVLVDCWAGWCGPCRQFAPVYEKAAERNSAHVFGKLDTQAEQDLVASLGVEHIPSLLVYRDGILLLRQAGNFDEQALQDIVRQAESVDMDAVRTEMTMSQAGASDR